MDRQRKKKPGAALLRIASVAHPGSPTGDPSSSPLPPRQIPPSVACETTVQGLQQTVRMQTRLHLAMCCSSPADLTDAGYWSLSCCYGCNWLATPPRRPRPSLSTALLALPTVHLQACALPTCAFEPCPYLLIPTLVRRPLGLDRVSNRHCRVPSYLVVDHAGYQKYECC